MNIAYLVPSLAKSGPVKVVHELTRILSRDNYIKVFYFKETLREKLEFDVDVSHISEIRKIDFDEFDIVHSHGFIPDAYVWLYKKRSNRAKFITTLHNYMKEDLSYTYGKLKAIFLTKLWNIFTSRHDHIVVLSKDAKEYYMNFLYNKNISYVYNGISVDLSEPFVKKSQPSRKSCYIKVGTIASAGGVNKRKGIDQIIMAIRRLPDFELNIAGKLSSESEELFKLSESLGAANRVNFVGFFSDIDSFIREQDLFVIAPRSEGFSLALQEVVKHRKPVICTDLPIFRELFSDEEVRFFKVDDIEELAREIIEASKGDNGRVNKAYNRFISNYTTEKMAEGYMAIYKKVVGGI